MGESRANLLISGSLSHRAPYWRKYTLPIGWRCTAISESQLALLELLCLRRLQLLILEVTLSARSVASAGSGRPDILVEASIDRDSRVTLPLQKSATPLASNSERPPLTPGLLVEVGIAGKPIQQSVELPATALRGDNTVLLVNENSRLERLPVELLRRERDRVWVRGIAAGQSVVAEQSSLLAAGAAIEVAGVRDGNG